MLITDEAMKRKDKQIEELNTKVQQDKPKVVFADAITGSNTSILIGELAKLIRQNCPNKAQKGYNIGQNRLYEWMRENDYIGKSGNFYNVPNQRYIEQGLFKLRTNSFSVNGKMLTKNTTLVTGKGQQYFINKFLAEEGAERELDF